MKKKLPSRPSPEKKTLRRNQTRRNLPWGAKKSLKPRRFFCFHQVLNEDDDVVQIYAKRFARARPSFVCMNGANFNLVARQRNEQRQQTPLFHYSKFPWWSKVVRENSLLGEKKKYQRLFKFGWENVIWIIFLTKKITTTTKVKMLMGELLYFFFHSQNQSKFRKKRAKKNKE